MTKPKTQDVADRITAYLASGGLFNPEMAHHNAVRDLLIDCREALAVAQADTRRLDWLEAQGAGRPWVARPSTTGRGYRLINSSLMPHLLTARAALDAAMEAK